MMAPRLPGVGDAVDGDEERRPSLTAPDQRREVGFGEGRCSGEHALGCLAAGRRLELGAPDVRERDPIRRREGDDALDRVVALEVARDPDLVDLAALGDQQLPHGLATLDLLATQILDRILGRLRLGLGRPVRRAFGSARSDRRRGSGTAVVRSAAGFAT